MATPVDLRQLAVERPAAGAGSSVPRRRTWPLKWGLPLAIVAAFALVVGWSARDHWLPATPVTVAPVLLTRAERQEAGTPLFQAAGWIEPRPRAVMASALVEGIVEELLVVEGQEVEAGQPVARLVDAEARLALSEAEAAEQLRVAELAATKATLAAAQKNFDNPTHLEVALADADAALAELNTEIKNLPFALKAAESRLQLAQQDLDGKRSVGDAIAGRALQKAQSELDAASAAAQELRERRASLELQREACQRKGEALRARLALKTDEKRALDEAQANLAAAEARLAQARLAVEAAKLRLDRMSVRAPIQGRVLSIHASPGSRLMGLSPNSEQDASTVALLYDPKMLQVRADVRLEDVPQVQPGQRVQISTAAAKEPLTGQVLAATSQADNLKNTLQVKVSIDDPLQVIKPEMLAQVTFLAPKLPGKQTAGEENPLRLLVPRELIEAGEGRATVWVADLAQGVARRKSVQIGRASTGPLLEVKEGLSALDKLIVMGRESLEDGQRIRVTGEDRTLGTSAAQSVVAAQAPAGGKQNEK